MLPERIGGFTLQAKNVCVSTSFTHAHLRFSSNTLKLGFTSDEIVCYLQHKLTIIMIFCAAASVLVKCLLKCGADHTCWRASVLLK